jgi:chromosome segregation protein
MYLKKLALSGFKTFADDTIIELGPGMTAIVGPNGSGKSNIVDAMLWALGERSNKSLRAHASTDVIFSGSGDRRALGMAEVSLFFDNEDGALPLKFPEVQVTRRLFRSGDAQYAINKTNCRLRDVTDLFLDTGLGPDAYSIVSQSEIDAILSAKPEDRRNLLESAAGVQKYRARRNETRRKLERVDADLLRVRDITSELESQLAPLESQARAARDFDEMQARLKYLQLALLAREYDVRLKRLSHLREGKETHTNAVLEQLQQIENLESDEARSEARLRELEGAMDALQTETTDVVSRLKGAEGDLAVARERRRALSEQQEFLAQEIGLLRARTQAAREAVAAQKRELEAAVRESGALSGEAAQAEAKAGAANARLQEATRELQGLQGRVIELMRASQQKRESAAGGRAQSEALQTRVAELEKLAHSIEEEHAQVLEARKNAQAELEKLQAQGREALARIESARAQVLAAQQKRDEAAREVSKSREERSSLRSRAGALRELEESLEGVQGGARGVLAAVKRGQLNDDFTLVADAIRAPQEIETAIEIALGGAVHNLICDREADAKNGIRFLKENRAGRATFLPLDALRPSGVGERTRAILREPGVRGLASELVGCDERDRKAVDYLLGRVVVVDDLDVATRLARRCDSGARLVTLDGDLVLPAGAITGGQGKQKTSGLLARKRELDELDDRLRALDEAVSARESAVANSQKAIDETQAVLRRAQEESGEMKGQTARQEREIEHLEREARRLKTHRDATSHQMANARTSLEAKTSKLDEHDKEAARLDEQARELDALVARAQGVVAQRQQEREEVSSSVSQVRSDFSASQERLNAMKRAIAEAERGLVEAEGQIKSRQAGIERASGEDALIIAREAQGVWPRCRSGAARWKKTPRAGARSARRSWRGWARALPA